MIGFIGSRTPDKDEHLVAAFRIGLNEIGYVEGQNVAIEFLWAEGQYDRLPAMTAGLVHRRVAVIAAMAGTPAAVTAKAETTDGSNHFRPSSSRKRYPRPPLIGFLRDQSLRRNSPCTVATPLILTGEGI